MADDPRATTSTTTSGDLPVVVHASRESRLRSTHLAGGVPTTSTATTTTTNTNTNTTSALVDIPRPKTMSVVTRKKRSAAVLPLLSENVKVADYYAQYYGHLDTLRLAPPEKKATTSTTSSSTSSSSSSSAVGVAAVETALYSQNALQVVDFYDRGLGPLVGEALARLFEYKREHGVRHNIQVIILDANPKMGARGVTPLFQALKNDPVVTTLHLEDIDLKDAGAIALATLLEGNPTITHVNVASNDIGAEGVAALSKALTTSPSSSSSPSTLPSALQFLGLSYNPRLKDAGAEALACALKEGGGGGGGGGAQALRALELIECRVGDSGLLALGVALSIHQKLVSLNVTSNHISDAGLDAFGDLLQRNTSLTTPKFTPCDHVSSLKLKRVIRRNRRLRQDSGPRHLEKVVIRLYHQQYKLQQAQQTLKEHQRLNVDLEDSAAKTEAEFNALKQETLRRMKDVSSTIGFTTTAAADLRVKREAMRADFEKLQKDSEDAIATLKAQLEALQKTVATADAELERNSQVLDELKRKDEARRDDYSAKVQAARQEAEVAHAQHAELTAKIDDVQAQIAAAQGKK